MSRTVEVWDKPTRVFHWGFGLSVLAAWITAEGDVAQHLLFGCVAAGFLAFRVIWGFIGSETALFSQFVKGPAAALAIARGAPWTGWGHNPLAGLAVLALLGAVAWVTATGLALGDGSGADEAAKEAHKVAFNVLGVLIGMHVLAIFAYPFWRGEALIGPMVSGTKTVTEDAPPAPTIRRDRAALAAAGAAAAVAAALYASL